MANHDSSWTNCRGYLENSCCHNSVGQHSEVHEPVCKSTCLLMGLTPTNQKLDKCKGRYSIQEKEKHKTSMEEYCDTQKRENVCSRPTYTKLPKKMPVNKDRLKPRIHQKVHGHNFRHTVIIYKTVIINWLRTEWCHIRIVNLPTPRDGARRHGEIHKSDERPLLLKTDASILIFRW